MKRQRLSKEGVGDPTRFTVSRMPFFRSFISKVCRKKKVSEGINKERVSRYTIVVLILIIVIFPGIKKAYNQDHAANTYLEKAKQAAEWINAYALKIPGESKVWPADPRALHTIDNTLYTGNPGVILFFLEAYYSTGKKQYLDDACKGANYLLAAVAHQKGSKIYGFFKKNDPSPIKKSRTSRKGIKVDSSGTPGKTGFPCGSNRVNARCGRHWPVAVKTGCL